jgi:hypothetical protein
MAPTDVPGHRAEVDILEIRFGCIKSRSGRGITVDARNSAPGEEPGGDDRVFALEPGSSSREMTRRQIRPRKSSTARIGSASSRISPRSMMAIRVQSSLTSSTMWVERRTTLFSLSSRAG